jgi:hypothetical protein
MKNTPCEGTTMKDNNDDDLKNKETLKTIEELQALVQKHQICWEVLPERVPVKGDNPLKIGFNLILLGTHASEDHPVPGCEKCQGIFKDLRQIAQWILPKDERLSRYEIEIFDSAIRYSPARGNRPDVQLTIQIMHRSEFDKPVDECEVFCLNEMKAKLRELGSRQGRWKEIM